MSAIKAFARQQEWKRRMDEVMAQPRTTTGSNATLRALQRTLRDAGMLPTGETPPPAPRYAPPPWQPSSPLNELLSAATAAVVANMRRHLPATPEPEPAVPSTHTAAPVPTPASTAPAPSKPMPREVAFHRDLDGNLISGQVGDQRLRFQRGRNGEIKRAEITDGRVVIFKRDHNGMIAGARIEATGPK